MSEVMDGRRCIRGRKRGFQVLASGLWVPATDWSANLVLYEWAALAARALLSSGNYRINGMYLEFKNVAGPGDPVAVPVFDRTRSRDYYDDLADSPDADYLRVPLHASLVESSDESLYPQGNRMILSARSQGIAGVHGKPYSHANNSVVYGMALVGMVHTTDATQDLIFSASYWQVAEQQPKLATSQVGVEWELTLE